MYDNIKLSVLVAFCKQEKYIHETLESILSQNVDFRYEILIGLDGNYDNSEQIIKKYIKKYPFIKLIKTDNSKLNTINIIKASKNRLNCLLQAKGEYICFLDGDDFYCDNNRFKTLVNFLDNNLEYIAAFHDYYDYDEKTKQIIGVHKYKNLKNRELDANGYTKNKIHMQISNYIFRNIFFGIIPEDLNVNAINDTSFIHYMLRYGKFYHIPETMFCYRRGIDSIFSNLDKNYQLLYALLYTEINHQILPVCRKNLCDWHKKKIKKIFKICRKNNFLKDKEANPILEVAKKENCYFTYNFIKYNSLTPKEKFSVWYNYLKYIYLKQYTTPEKIRFLLYFNSRSNFGDQLNLYILQRILNLNIIKRRFSKNKLYGIGSILEHLYKRKELKRKNNLITIFGSGFIRAKEHNNKIYSRLNILALRGEISKKRMENEINKDLSNIVLGDPGLLCKKLINTNNTEKRYKAGIILHYVDETENYKENIDIDNYKIINIGLNPILFLHEIAECEVIFSSAMHGLIAADSLGIPNQRLKISQKIIGGDYKFNDYYSVFNNTRIQPIELLKSKITDKTVENLKNNYQYTKIKDQVNEINTNLLKVAKQI